MKAVLLVLALAATMAGIPSWRAGSDQVIGGDGPDVPYFFALHAYAGARLRAGEFPLWNPHLLGGVPFLANMQAAVLYPPHLLRALLPGAGGYNLLALLHFFLAGAGAAWFAARLGIPRTGQVVAGFTFAWSGPLITHLFAGHAPFLATYAWTGCVFAAVHRLREHPGPPAAALLAVLIALQFFAGYVHCWYYTLLGAGGYAVVLALAGVRRCGWQRERRFAAAAAAAFGLGLLLAAPQLLPTIEFAGHSSRADMPAAVAATFSLTPEALLSLVIPAPFGDGLTVPYWGRYYPWELCAYAGIVSLCLAVSALLGGRTAPGHRHLQLLALLAAGALLLALADRTPLFAAARALLPGFALLRGHAKLLGLVVFCLALLAGAGSAVFLRLPPRRRAALLAVFLLLPAVIGVSTFLPGPPATALWPQLVQAMARVHTPYTAPVDPADPALLRQITAHVRGQALTALLLLGVLALLPLLPGRTGRLALIALVMLDLGPVALPYLSTVAVTLPAGVPALLNQLPGGTAAPYRVLAPALPIAFGMREGLDNAQGNDAILPGATFRYLNFSQGVVTPRELTSLPAVRRFSPLIDRLGVRFVLRHDAEPLPPLILRRRAGAWQLWENPVAAPRYLLTGRAVAVPPAALLAMLDSTPAGDTVLLTRPLPVPLTGTAGTVRLLTTSPEQHTLAVSADGTMLLVERSTRYPGWQATVDGRTVPLVAVDYLFRGILVPGGTHQVVFRFRPVSWLAGSLLALLAGLLLLGWRWRSGG